MLCTLALSLAGCGFPGVYKIDVQQGNVITQEMIDQLRPGMTTRQVRFIMGTPLVQDTFAPNRWDYLYSMKTGHQERTQERVSLMFEDDLLVGLAGDFVPGTSRDEAIMGSETTEAPTIESYPVDLGAPLGTGE
ncbi:MAG TPA: outer membrane protein assembly factor BamE [Pseudomonas xinjiangensis]|uniref:Outer membrane protein assembly factor BamE n=2 Tax=root TaxID=1 RepID=A0A7V1FRK7_9GAMM|nr:outer membrane protein assembly factor BamE [Halopseudomonas xinjiangensis]HEC46372.1 outer membrane protein assembly factor BamE [Halopseudomonas xinjiangensis]